MTNLRNIFYVDIEMRDIMKKYLIKRNPIIYHNFVISICLNYVDKLTFHTISKNFSSPKYARAKIMLH